MHTAETSVRLVIAMHALIRRSLENPSTICEISRGSLPRRAQRPASSYGLSNDIPIGRTSARSGIPREQQSRGRTARDEYSHSISIAKPATGYRRRPSATHRSTCSPGTASWNCSSPSGSARPRRHSGSARRLKAVGSLTFRRAPVHLGPRKHVCGDLHRRRAAESCEWRYSRVATTGLEWPRIAATVAMGNRPPPKWTRSRARARAVYAKHPF